MKKKKSQLIQKGFARYLANRDRANRLILERKIANEQGLMLVLLSAVVFLVGFSFTLLGHIPEELIASPPVHHATALEREIDHMVVGYPIERMSEEIAKHDRLVAAFVVAIAKKESNWGKRVPTLDGKDCYNYWGFREKRDRMGTGGHTCFDSPQDAVRSVSKRIESLIYEYNQDTPREMIVWKCGSSCDGHSPESVSKWISDVGYYFQKLKTEKVAQNL
ncbi:MAG: hypothetical protein WBO66_05105 [Candidatus Moraniibacteriota bacterium]